MDSLNKGINSIHSKVNLISSYSYIYKNPARTVEFPKNREKLMIDSGAFDLIIRENLDDFPFTPKEYAKAIKNLQVLPDYVVSMDYICSPDDTDNNKKLILKTISNAEKLRNEFKREENILFIPVIQGYYKEEYLFCVKEMVRKNIIKKGDYIGIGSLATRKQVKEPREIIKGIYNYLKKQNIEVKIHCFGLNLNILKSQEIFNMINSIDSLAWTFPYRFGRVKMFTRERMIEANSNRRLKEPDFYFLSLEATLKYIEFLNLLYNSNFKDSSISLEPFFNNKNHEEILQKYKLLAAHLGIHDALIKKAKNPNELFQLIIDYNHKFPRDRDLYIERIPTFTGKTFLMLDPKNCKIGKFEFLYLFLTSLENAYKSSSKNENDPKSKFVKLLRNISTHLSESDSNIIKESLEIINYNGNFYTLVNSKDYVNLFENFINIINAIKEKIELKVYKIQKNYHQNQKDLRGKLINNDYFLYLEDIDFIFDLKTKT